MMQERGASDVLSSRSFAQWFGVLGPPLAWGAHLVLGDLIFELGCAPGVGPKILGLRLETWAIIETVAAAALIAAAGVMAFGAWRRLSRISDGTRWSRAHAMAIAGIASSAIYLLLVVFGFVAPLFLRTCSTSL